MSKGSGRTGLESQPEWTKTRDVLVVAIGFPGAELLDELLSKLLGGGRFL